MTTAAWAEEEKPYMYASAWVLTWYEYNTGDVLDKEGDKMPQNLFKLDRGRFILGGGFRSFFGQIRIQGNDDSSVVFYDGYFGSHILFDWIKIKLGKFYVPCSLQAIAPRENPLPGWWSPGVMAILPNTETGGIMSFTPLDKLIEAHFSVYNGEDSPEQNESKDVAGYLNITPASAEHGYPVTWKLGGSYFNGVHVEDGAINNAIAWTSLRWKMVELLGEFYQKRTNPIDEEIRGNGWSAMLRTEPLEFMQINMQIAMWQPDQEIDLWEYMQTSSIVMTFKPMKFFVAHRFFQYTSETGQASDLPDYHFLRVATQIDF